MSAVHNHPHPAPCCHHHHEQTVSEKIFQILEKVSAIAVGIFAAYASMELFLPFFLVGVGAGIYQHFTSTSHEHAHHEGGSCAQGFLEQLTGAKLPPLISLGANLAVTWCHIDHHTTVFVPVVGLSMGAWAGQSLSDFASRFLPIRQALA